MQDYVFKDDFLEENGGMEVDTFEKQNEIKKIKKRKRTESWLRLLMIQTVMCTVIVLMALLTKYAAPETYKNLKSGYISATTLTDVSYGDLKYVIGKIKEFLFSPEKNGNKATSVSSQNETVSDTSSGEEVQSTQPSGGEDFKSTQPSTISENAYVLTGRISAPAKGTVTSLFGQRVHPITKTPGYHTGIDIAAELGTPITAAFGGVVSECGVSEAYGNYIIMKHSDGLCTFYAHCDSIKATNQMRIRKGEIIAFVGSTGYSTGPHLHFEIRINGLRVNPAYALKGNESIEFQDI